MTTTIRIKATLLSGAYSIQYKYAVLNYQSANIKSCFEFLHWAPGKGDIVNRCLIIPIKSCQPGGMYKVHCVLLSVKYPYHFFYIQIVFGVL